MSTKPRDPLRAFPPRETLEWVAQAIGPGAEVSGGRRLTGGATSVVHALTVVQRGGGRVRVVLRRWIEQDPDEGATRVRLERAILTRLEGSGLPVPRVLAADATGSETGGERALLMTKVPGRVLLAPRDPDRSVAQMAAMLPRIHELRIDDAPPFDEWLDVDRLAVPVWTTYPDLWRSAIEIVRAGATPYEPRFIHRDYQHFNMLWSRERLTGIVDWVFSSMGSPDVDVGHCRLNLAVLYSADRAERFRRAYEAEAGRRVDPWWDLAELLVYLPGWGSLIEKQAGRHPVDHAGMHDRVEALLRTTLKRL